MIVTGITTLSWNCARTSSHHLQFLGGKKLDNFVDSLLPKLGWRSEVCKPWWWGECAMVGWMQGGDYERQIGDDQRGAALSAEFRALGLHAWCWCIQSQDASQSAQ